MTQITAPGTYTVRFDGSLSGKRFADAKAAVKDKLQGQYDPATKQWTVTIVGEPVERERTERCGWCRDGGREGAFARERNAAGVCAHCNGSGGLAKRWTEQPPEVAELTSLRDAYGAIVEPATGQQIDAAALVAERKQIVARLAELDRLLGQQ